LSMPGRVHAWSMRSLYACRICSRYPCRHVGSDAGRALGQDCSNVQVRPLQQRTTTPGASETISNRYKGDTSSVDGCCFIEIFQQPSRRRA
jgi:predicted transcriptional regulator with HTH domain